MRWATRLLPPAEWPRLAETELGPALDTLDPAAVTVIVAEDAAGAIIGCWSLITFAHVEGLWIAPAHRRRGTVLRELFERMCAVATDRGIPAVLTRSLQPTITRWILKRGGHPLPGEGFVLPLQLGRSR